MVERDETYPRCPPGPRSSQALLARLARLRNRDPYWHAIRGDEVSGQYVDRPHTALI